MQSHCLLKCQAALISLVKWFLLICKVEASGGSDVHISGRADKLTIDASGGSDFKGYDLVSDICTLDASGGAMYILQ